MTLQDIFRDESTWIQHYYALDAKGNITKPEADDAVSWCIVGALCKAYGQNAVFTMRPKIEQYTGNHNLALWNDSPDRTFQDIIAVIKALDI